MSLVKALMKKQKSMGIGSKVALAAAIGVSAATLYKLYRSGTIRPNARTINAYAKFLRVNAAKVASLAGVAEGISQSRVKAGAGSKARGKGKRAKAKA